MLEVSEYPLPDVGPYFEYGKSCGTICFDRTRHEFADAGIGEGAVVTLSIYGSTMLAEIHWLDWNRFTFREVRVDK